MTKLYVLRLRRCAILWYIIRNNLIIVLRVPLYNIVYTLFNGRVQCTKVVFFFLTRSLIRTPNARKKSPPY